jgi:error-prone DNA polymerase
VRSGFSYGYGVATPEELAGAAAGMGMRSMALTDRDGLYGIPRFLEVAGEAGVSPIVGAEVSISGGGHLVLLAEGIEGYRSLCRLITAYRCSSEDRRRPSCPLETVLDHASGLVCLTGAIPFGLIPGLVLSERGARAAEVAGLLREAFGRDGVFVELTDDGTAGGRKRLARLAAFAREKALPTLATNEAAYLRPEDHRLHEVLVAASHLSRLPGPSTVPRTSSTSSRPGRCAGSSRDTRRPWPTPRRWRSGAPVPWTSRDGYTCPSPGSRGGRRRGGF